MPRIHHLDNITVNQIAAGEVIERPASVVKELIENSIDAGCTAVTVETDEGGTGFIRITDNGSGMEPADALLSFERHATSKINHSSDLHHILSLGFRGEALASIAAVSKMEMITRTKGELSGFRILNHGGEITLAQETGCPEGTTLIVSNLFYNTPARLKFLKSIRSETAAISDLVAKLIMAHAEISFKYIHHNKIIYHSPGNGILQDAIFSVYGKEVRHGVIEVEKQAEEQKLHLWGQLGKPALARFNRNHQSFFVNGRYIKSLLLSSCLEEAYKTRILINQYPWAVLHLELPPHEIDINVHPAKTEIRFKHEEAVYRMLLAWFQETIEGNPFIPSSSDGETKEEMSSSDVTFHISKTPAAIQNASDQVAFFRSAITQDPILSDNRNQPPFQHERNDPESSILQVHSDEEDYEIEDKKPFDSGMKEENIDNTIHALEITAGKIIGSAFSTYIIVERESSLYILDQHAAHERYLYEQLKEMIDAQNAVSQQLLPPFVLEVTHSEYTLILDHMKLFANIGFEIEPFGGSAFLIRGVPILLKEIGIREFFHRLTDTAMNGGETTKSMLQQEDIIRMSCKMAVKGNQPLAEAEILGLLRDLKSKKIPWTCPHGRPIMIYMTRYELEKKFKRVQS